MLKLRRGVVIEAETPEPWQNLTVDVDGEQRPARADTALIGPCEPGDEVVVNVEARDLQLGSGGFDVVHVNLTRGLAGDGTPDAHVMKLNYTSLQHAVLPVEGESLALPLAAPVAVCSLHGQLSPLAWALAQARPGTKVGYVQTGGGALTGAMSDSVRELLERGLLAEHVTAGPAYGGAREAITTAGAIHDGIAERGWDVALVGPGPGILGSGSALGHGGIVALDSAHAALALGCPTVLVARMSSGDTRERHRGLSHHTRTVLDLLLAPVTLPVPLGVARAGGHALDAPAASADGSAPVASLDAARGSDAEAGDGLTPIASLDAARARRHAVEEANAAVVDAAALVAALNAARACGHAVEEAAADLDGYRASGLPARTMGRTIDEDELFFAAALAAGAVVAGLIEETAQTS